MSKSIVQQYSLCFLCGRTYPLEKHHIFGGANRKKSEKYGLYVYLCHNCHNEPPEGVHHNKENMDRLRAIGQRAFQKAYPDKNFLKEFGKNYLDDVVLSYGYEGKIYTTTDTKDFFNPVYCGHKIIFKGEDDGI